MKPELSKHIPWFQDLDKMIKRIKEEQKEVDQGKARWVKCQSCGEEHLEKTAN